MSIMAKAVVAGVAVIAAVMAVGAVGGIGCGGSSAGPSTSNLTCPSSSSVCDKAQVEAYGACIASACDTQYKSCFGDAYASGTFSGPCGTYYGCLARCSCNDNNCRQACGIASADCQLCIGNTIYPCVQMSGCTEPACTDGSVGSHPQLTCDDLATCCAAISDATQKSICQMEYTMAKAYGNTICDSFARGFKQTGACP